MSQELIDKQYAYGDYRDAEKANWMWREKLAEKVAHKSVDIPMDNQMAIQADNRTTNVQGMGWKELAAIGALGLGGILGYGAVTKPTIVQPPAAAVAPAAPQQNFNDTDTKYDIRWRN